MGVQELRYATLAISSGPAYVADGSRTMIKAVLLVPVLLLAAASLPQAQPQSTPLSLSKYIYN